MTRLGLALLALTVSVPAPAAAQAFAGGAVVAWSGFAAAPDPDGSGYIEPYFHGSPEWPAAGVTISAGVFVARAWTLGGELALRRSQVVDMVEQGRFKFESWETTSRYTDREMLVSVLAGRQFTAGPRVDVHAIGGATLSRSRVTVTQRHRTYSWYGGTILSRPPDQEVESTEGGVSGGLDLLVRVQRRAAVTVGARVHWIVRTTYERDERIVPARDPVVLLITAGVRWRS